MSVTCSSSTSRAGGVLPPDTHTVSSVEFLRPWSSVTTPVMRYWPPSGVANEHVPAAAAEVSAHAWTSSSVSTYLPLSYFQSSRTAWTSMALPTTALPSRSTSIASISMAWPLSTYGFLARMPT